MDEMRSGLEVLTVISSGHTSSGCAVGGGACILLQGSVGNTARSAWNGAVSVLWGSGKDRTSRDG